MNSASTFVATPPPTKLAMGPTSGNSLNKSKSILHLRKKPSSLHPLSRSSSATLTNSTVRTKTSYTKANASSNHRFGSFIKKLSTEFNTFFSKIKSISEDSFITNEIIDDLFLDSDSDSDTFDKILARSDRTYTSAEEAFIEEFKKFKNLNKMAESHQQQMLQAEEVKSCTTAASNVSWALQDVIRQQSASSGTRVSSPVRKHEVDYDQEEKKDVDNENYHNDDISFHRIDFQMLRQELERAHVASIKHPSELGTVLWNYRRKKWLHTSNPGKAEHRGAQQSLEHVPRECYVKIYNNLIDKGKSLKPGKHMNLSDLLDVINVGWIAEEKWERAAKGLP